MSGTPKNGAILSLNNDDLSKDLCYGLNISQVKEDPDEKSERNNETKGVKTTSSRLSRKSKSEVNQLSVKKQDLQEEDTKTLSDQPRKDDQI